MPAPPTPYDNMDEVKAPTTCMGDPKGNNKGNQCCQRYDDTNPQLRILSCKFCNFVFHVTPTNAGNDGRSQHLFSWNQPAVQPPQQTQFAQPRFPPPQGYPPVPEPTPFHPTQYCMMPSQNAMFLPNMQYPHHQFAAGNAQYAQEAAEYRVSGYLFHQAANRPAFGEYYFSTYNQNLNQNQNPNQNQ